MRSRVILSLAVFMMTIGVVSVWEQPVAANKKGGCCSLANPYHCEEGTCTASDSCIVFSGTCQ